jgi:uncharacterized membrane protein YfcA
MMDWPSQILLFAISLVANIFSAFAGGGAGLVQFPALIFLGLPFGVALATHKIASVALGVGATLRHAREGNMEWRLSLWILAAGLPGVLLGAASILQLPERWARIALGLLTISLGAYSTLHTKLGLEYRQTNRHRWGHVIGGAGLFFIGFLNGSLSSGTGLFCTLWLVRWYGMDYKRAVAHTLILVGMFWNGSGALVLGVLGDVQWTWLPVLLLGSLLGGYIGAHWSLLKGNRWIKRVYEAVTLIIGIKLIV